jgi:hypothetical protein
MSVPMEGSDAALDGWNYELGVYYEVPDEK